MSELPPDPAPVDAPVEPIVAVPFRNGGSMAPSRWRPVVLGSLALLAVLTCTAMAVAWRANRHVGDLEQELVRRQQDSGAQANEARLLARDAQEAVRDAGAKLALLEARVAEVSVQRTQLDDLIQSLSRSRDENILGDVEASVRVAVQQTVITGSAEPLVAALKQTDERLARYDEPRLQAVRRAVERDLDRIKSVSVADMPSLASKLDEAIRLVDTLPLLAGADARREPAVDSAKALPRPTAAATSATATASAAATVPAASTVTVAAFDGLAVWGEKADGWWRAASGGIWSELKSLVRVTRVDHPDAMLLAPEQAFFVRENLKLRLLNARLALLSRQFDTAQADMTVARGALDHYFERGARRTALALDLINQVSAQARQVNLPRPDETLAALTAAAVGGR